MLGLTMFNTSHVKKVANANVGVSIFKIILPVSLAIFVILMYGKFDNVVTTYDKVPFDMSNILFVITSTGMAFAFSGFQNGLILASEAKRPNIAIPLSVIVPVLVGLCMYVLLTMIYVFCMSGQTSGVFNAAAPLLGILSMLGLNYIFMVLFLDAVISPLGTANVFTAVTARILQTVGLVFGWKKIQILNKNQVPIAALWINFFVALLFLLPMPTWSELVNFLSSLLMLTCMSGPVAMMIFRTNKPDADRKFRLKAHTLFGYLGFIGCTLFVYWSGLENLAGLFVLAIVLLIIYQFSMVKCHGKIKFDSLILILYLFSLTLVSFLAKQGIIPFPYDHAVIVVISVIFLNVLISCRDTKENIDTKTNDILQEEK
jgi:amino acid transporter